MAQNLSSQFEKCKAGLHSFEYMNYIPDFQRHCYVLKFECEYCELVIFDNIKVAVVSGNTPSGLDSIMQRLKDDKDPIYTYSRDGKDGDLLSK
jgi:hypothetical protein